MTPFSETEILGIPGMIPDDGQTYLHNQRPGIVVGYMTWRETKAAILLFNRNRDFSSVLAQIPEVAKSHPHFVRMDRHEKSTGFRFIVKHPSEAARHVTVTVLAFDVPQPAVI